MGSSISVVLSLGWSAKMIIYQFASAKAGRGKLIKLSAEAELVINSVMEFFVVITRVHQMPLYVATLRFFTGAQCICIAASSTVTRHFH